MNTGTLNGTNDVHFNTEIISLNTANESFEEEKFNYFNAEVEEKSSIALNPFNITEQFYQLHLLKQQQLQEQNETPFKQQQNYKENLHKTQEYQQQNGLQFYNSREQFDIDNYEPPQYESWEEEEDLDVIIELNRSNSISSGIFQFDNNNKDYMLNTQLQTWKL